MKGKTPFSLLLLLITASCSNGGGPLSALHSKWKLLMGDHDDMLATENEFVSLEDDDLKGKLAETTIPQPKEIPGGPGSGIPSLDQFRRAVAELAQIFQNVYFNTDDYILRRSEYLHIVNKIADHMKKNPKLYVSIGGHCDERGSEAYNLALGTKRSNSIRSLLVQRGVDANHVHTISFGKEHPMDIGHSPTSWTRNRRVEFKIYEKP